MDSHSSNLYLSFRMTCVQIRVPVAQWNPLRVNQVQKDKTKKKTKIDQKKPVALSDRCLGFCRITEEYSL